MASEAISSAILIIGAVIGAAVMVTAILPAIFSAGDTFGTVSHAEEDKLRTDFRIVNTYTAGDDKIQVWMKNVGSKRIYEYDIEKSDVFLQIGTTVSSYGYNALSIGGFNYSDLSDHYWDNGETIEITLSGISPVIDSNTVIYTFSLPNSVKRTTTFSKTTE